MLTFLSKFFYNPTTAFFIFLIFVTGYLIFLDEEGAFQKKFLHFGPSTDPKIQTKFINMKLDTWKKVILVYVISLLSAVIQAYYGNVVSQFIHQHLWNPAVKKIEGSKVITLTIITFEQIIWTAVSVITFFTNMTMQVQFIIPSLIGSMITNIPFDLYQASMKTFTLP